MQALITGEVEMAFVDAVTALPLMQAKQIVPLGVSTPERNPLAPDVPTIAEAGFPAGVFNVLSGHGVPSGAVLARHMDVRALSFTGSGRTGRLIQEVAAKTNLKKVILELGGKSPALVFEDADLDKAVSETAQA